jgi:hypothetical protein
VPIFLKSGSLKLLELSESVHACNGIALHFTSNYIKCNDITIGEQQIEKEVEGS